MVKVEDMIANIKRIAKDTTYVRNMCICAHIDHGKTTLSDNLLSGAGMISEELSGTQRFMDFDPQEAERGITIYSANASMVHHVNGHDYVINLIDTPGHVDFGGDVTRAMRAVDGAVVVVCAVEGAMPQTETVLRQALKERVKPVLFINKVDRLINELKLTPEQMQERFMKHIMTVNNLIQKYASDEFKEKWQVDVLKGTVAFGSAYNNWAMSVPFMKKTGINFKGIIDYVTSGKQAELAQKAKLHEVLLDMAITHLPAPKDAQPYRIAKLWTGDVNTAEGQSMAKCDANGPLMGIVTNVSVDPHAGSISTVRLMSGTIREGQQIRLVGQDITERIQNVGVSVGPRRVPMGEIPAGNIVAITGLTKSYSGETVCSPDLKIPPFEGITHLFEPVVTKSIEVKDVKDLPKMIDILRQRSKEDPTIKIKISEDTGETLVSALGELHIEAKIERYLKDRGVNIIVSKPIIIYKEAATKESKEWEGKSPNKHNRFYIKVAPLPEAVGDYLKKEGIETSKVRTQDVKPISAKLQEAGVPKAEADKIVDIYKGSILLNMTKGIVALNEVIQLVVDAFHQVCDEGPLAKEPCMGMKVMLMDAKLHEDAIHRGAAQVYPAVRQSLKNAMIDGEGSLFEPKQIMRIDTPSDMMGNVFAEINNRRGQILEMNEDSGMTVIVAKLPVVEMTGFEGALKSATGGRGFQSLVDVTYEKLPKELQPRTILDVRKRKGMKEELPQIEVD